MYTTRFIRLRYLIPHSIYTIFIPLVSSILVYVLYVVFGYHNIAIPLIPISIIGTAVSFYVGFKNNSSYDRLWEARRMWGSITNTSRMLASMIIEVVMRRGNEEIPGIGRAIILRHIGWCNALRLQLRKTKVWNERYYQNYVARLQLHEDAAFDKLMSTTLEQFCTDDDLQRLKGKSNIANYLLHIQNGDLKELKERGIVDAFEHTTLTSYIMELYNQQGGCERIKSYPFPRQYAVFSRLFVDIFMFILPFALVAEIVKIAPATPWLLIPVCITVAWIFNAMESVGDFSENPFENAVTDIPISAICRNIEVDLKELMDEAELPQRLQPHDGILM